MCLHEEWAKKNNWITSLVLCVQCWNDFRFCEKEWKQYKVVKALMPQLSFWNLLQQLLQTSALYYFAKKDMFLILVSPKTQQFKRLPWKHFYITLNCGVPQSTDEKPVEPFPIAANNWVKCYLKIILGQLRRSFWFKRHGALAVRFCPSGLITKELLLKLKFLCCNIQIFTDTADEVKFKYRTGAIQPFLMKHWNDELEQVAWRSLFMLTQSGEKYCSNMLWTPEVITVVLDEKTAACIEKEHHTGCCQKCSSELITTLEIRRGIC